MQRSEDSLRERDSNITVTLSVLGVKRHDSLTIKTAAILLEDTLIEKT